MYLLMQIVRKPLVGVLPACVWYWRGPGSSCLVLTSWMCQRRGVTAT